MFSIFLIKQYAEMKNTVKLYLCYCLVYCLYGCQVTDAPENTAEKIVIEMEISPEISNPRPSNFYMKDRLTMLYKPVNTIDHSIPWDKEEAKVSNNKVRWVIYSDKPVQINYGFGRLVLMNPGDSILVKYVDEEAYYLGKGSEKLKMWKLITEEEKKLGIPTKNCNTIQSINDYLKWNKYLDQKLLMQIPILDSFRNKIQPFAYDYLKIILVSQAEKDRINAFQALQKFGQKNPGVGIQTSDLGAIWDSTHNNAWSKWLWSLPDYYGSIYTLFDVNRLEVWRRFNFDSHNDSLKSTDIYSYLYFVNAEEKFKGAMREQLLVYIIGEIYLDKWGPDDPKTQKILKDYYSQPGYPEYKEWVKKLAGNMHT
jgi:hypothetical protein